MIIRHVSNDAARRKFMVFTSSKIFYENQQVEESLILSRCECFRSLLTDEHNVSSELVDGDSIVYSIE